MNQIVRASGALQTLDVVQARARIEAATTVEELRELQAQAEAIVSYLRSQGEAFEAQRREVESVKCDCTRKLGQLLQKQEKAKGTRGAGRPPIGGTRQELPKSDAPTLAAQGISKKLSSVAQQLAAIPDEQYEQAKSALDAPSPSKVLDVALAEMGDQAAEEINSLYAGMRKGHATRVAKFAAKRTKRDAEVLRLWNEEKSPQEIATILGVKENVVFASRRRLGLSRASKPRIQSLSDDIGAAAHAWSAATKEWPAIVDGASASDIAECRKRISAARTALNELRGCLEGKK